MWRAGLVFTMTGPALRDGAVAVEDGRVVEVGPADAVAGHVVREWPGVLLPGLVNAHAHLEYGATFADLAGAGLAFPDWIVELTRRRLGLDQQAWASADAAGSAHAALTTGTTCVGDVVTVGAAVRAAGDRGLRGTSYLEVAGADTARWTDAEQPRLAGLLAHPPSGRRLGVSPHTLYSLSGDVVRALVAVARTAGLRLHPHLAETSEEAEFVLSGTGRLAGAIRALLPGHDLLDRGSGVSPTTHLAALGGLGVDVHVAHGVHTDASDRALLRSAGTAVALCTRSNAVLGAGAAPVAAYRSEGSPVAVGTDSLASCPDLDLLAEGRALHALARRQGSPSAGLDDWVLHALTRGGAAALGEPAAGWLGPGSYGDLTLVDADPAQGARGALHGAARVTVLAGREVAG